MSIIAGIRAAATAYYETTGQRLVSITVAPEEWTWLRAEAHARRSRECDAMPGSPGGEVVLIDGCIWVAEQVRPVSHTGTLVL